jgi:WD40 repeat protein
MDFKSLKPPFKFLKTLDADDIFISYSRVDGEAYLTGIDAALSDLGFSCFSDKRGTEANPLPPETLFEKIRLCKTFVLLGTSGAVEKSEYIAPEVEAFAAANGTARIIGVSFDRDEDLQNWSNTPWYSQIVGKSRERERRSALTTGVPSPSIVKNIAKVSDYMKSKDRLTKYRNRALAGFLGLLIAGLLAGGFALYGIWQARSARKEAISAREQADIRIAKANDDAKKAEDQAKKDIQKARDDAQTDINKAQAEAKIKIDEADEETRKANDKRAAAEALRRTAQTEATRQQTIGASRSLANRAQVLMRQNPDALPKAVGLSFDALTKHHTSEADEALRESIARLPVRLNSNDYGGIIREAALSSDGRHFATVDLAGTLRVYDSGTPQPIKEIPGENLRVALSLNATRAAVVREREIIIYDLKENRNHSIACEPNDAIEKIAISPDGKYLAVLHGPLVPQQDIFYVHTRTAEASRRLRVQDSLTGTVIKSFDENFDMIISDVAFGPRGDLVIGGHDGHVDTSRRTGRVVIWPLSNLWPVTFSNTFGSSQELRGTPGQQLTAADFSHCIDLYLDAPVAAVALSYDDNIFATDTAVWKRVRSYRQEAVVRIPINSDRENYRDYKVERLAFNREGTQLTVVRTLPRVPGDIMSAARPGGRGVEVWDIVPHRETALAGEEGVTAMIKGVAFKPSGQLVAAVTNSNQDVRVRMFSSVDGAEVKSAALELGPEDDRQLSVNAGTGYAVTSDHGAVQVHRLWDATKIRVPFDTDIQAVNLAALSSDGKVLALAGRSIGDGKPMVLIYLNRSDSYKRWKPLALSFAPTFITLTHDGQFLITQYDDTVQVWDMHSGRDATPTGLRQLKGNIKAPQFSPGGHFIAVEWTKVLGVSRTNVRLWRTTDGAEMIMPKYHLTSYYFSPDDRYLLVMGFDFPKRSRGAPLPSDGISTMPFTHLVDVSTGRVVKEFSETALHTAAFSPDGRYLGLGSHQGLLHIYRINDVETPVANLQHNGIIEWIAFSDDNRYVSAANDRFDLSGLPEERHPSLRIWLLQTKELITEATTRLTGLPTYAR